MLSSGEEYRFGIAKAVTFIITAMMKNKKILMIRFIVRLSLKVKVRGWRIIVRSEK
jgi:hypothetical protein